MFKYYICPIIGDGSFEFPYRPKVADYSGVNWAGIIPSKSDGIPKFGWCLVLVSSSDFTNIEMDSTIQDIFQKYVSGNSWADIKFFLKSKTVGDIPLVERIKIRTYLTNIGVDFTDVMLSTTLLEILTRVKTILEPLGFFDSLRVE